MRRNRVGKKVLAEARNRVGIFERVEDKEDRIWALFQSARNMADNWP